jgi:hypothetical protein
MRRYRVICDTNRGGWEGGGGEGKGTLVGLLREVRQEDGLEAPPGGRLIKEASKGITAPEKCRTEEKKGGT